MDNFQIDQNNKGNIKKNEKKNKRKKTAPKNTKKVKKNDVELLVKKKKKSKEKKSLNINNNVKNHQTVINKNKKDEETNIPDIPDSKSSRLSTRLKTNSDDYKQYIIISSKNKELKLQIKEKNEKIKALTETQQRDKISLIELLKKVRKAIEENENVLFPEKSNIDEDENNNNEEKLLEKLEKIKKENNKIKEINKKYKEKYGIIKKYNINLNTSPIEEFDNLNTRINALKENNSFLNKEIVLLNHKNNLDKVRSLNPKYKISDVKNFSDKYISLTKEKYKQKTLLKNNKKVINEMVQKFKDLLQKINEEKEEIKNSELNREINILKKDLSGDEENIYNKIISDKSIIISNHYKNNIKLNNSTNNLRIMLTTRTQKIRLEKKGLFHNKSSQDINIQKYRKRKIKYISIDNKNINSISYDYDNIDYDLMSNVDFKNLSSKKQKYLNLTEKLDKTINDLTTFYENRIKEINILLDMNSKKLSNIHQENELLTSEIADMKRVLELNNITHKLMNVNNRSNFNNVYEDSIRKLNILKVKEKNISQINTNNFDNDRESYIEKIKKKYKNKIKLFHKESLLNNRTYI